MLAVALHPIISFVVLNSIVVRASYLIIHTSMCCNHKLPRTASLFSCTQLGVTSIRSPFPARSHLRLHRICSSKIRPKTNQTFHVAVDFELQSPKEPGSKTASPLSTTTPKVDVAFQERKNQTELENVFSVTSVSAPAQAVSLATSSIGPSGTPGSTPPCQSKAFAGLGTFTYKGGCLDVILYAPFLAFLVCRPMYYF